MDCREQSAGSGKSCHTDFDKIERLAIPGLAEMGRPGLDPGTRELIEYPYIIVYEVHQDRGDIVVLSVVHGAQARKPREE